MTRVNPVLRSFDPPSVRLELAQNLDTPPDILSQLSKDRDPSVRCSVAKNPNTPVEYLVQLAMEDRNKMVCEAAFNNPALPSNIRNLITLAEDEYPDY